MAMLAYDYNQIAAPELPIPGRKPIAPVKINYAHELAPLIHEVIGVPGFKQLIPAGTGAITETYGGNLGYSGQSANPVWEAPLTRHISGFSQYSVLIFFGSGNLIGHSLGSSLYCERPTSSQIFKIVLLDTKEISFVTRNAASGGLINLVTKILPDDTKSIHTAAFVKTSDSLRTLYVDNNNANNTTTSGGTYNTVTPTVGYDPKHLVSYLPSAAAAVFFVVTLKVAINSDQYNNWKVDPCGLFEGL